MATARIAAVSVGTIRSRVHKKALREFRAGRSVRILKADLDAFLTRTPEPSKITPQQAADEILARAALRDAERAAKKRPISARAVSSGKRSRNRP